jgi:formylglycine-generating enzyme required for sulfatase activity
MKRATAAAFLLGAASALLACDAILGIEVYADRDGGQDAQTGVDVAASVDASTSDTALPDAFAGDSQLDAGLDVARDVFTLDSPPIIPVCHHDCVPGTYTCTDGGISQCQTVYNPKLDAGCEILSPAVACTAGQVCWGAPSAATCCDGATTNCAPSCNTEIAADAGAQSGTRTGCGGSLDESCCTSLQVGGGTYLRSYDGVFNTDPTHPATVHTFTLDKYEVTVGRFRRFVDAWLAGWRPQDGSGVHSHLNGGLGLVDSSSGAGAHEQGWSKSWEFDFPASPDPLGWTNVLQCDGTQSTWTQAPGNGENMPINCIDWYWAYAFCIWDGGFLPSEAEWDYAAAGGGGSDGQRVYAWSAPPTSTTIDCTYASYKECADNPVPVGIFPSGAGKWGQRDLTGNLWEWTLDYFATYVTPCTDCAYLSNVSLGRSIRGSGFNYPAGQSYVGTRLGDPDTSRYGNDGIRCARPAP